MQTLTFTQKLLRQRGFLSSLIPLFALFIGLGSTQLAMAQAAYDTDYVTINATPIAPAPSTTTTYAGNANGNPPLFQGADLGGGAQFDQATGASTLMLTAAEANLLLVGPRTSVPSSRVLYRVYLLGTSVGAKPAYTSVDLAQTSPTNNNSPVSYGISSLTVDLLRQPSVLGGGTYIVEVKFESTVNRSNTATPPVVTPSVITDDNGSGDGFQASFSVISPAVTPPGGTTTWISTSSTDWTLASNWSNGVPTPLADATLPAKTTGSNNTVTPVLDLTTPNLYEVRTLNMLGVTNGTRALLRIGNTTGGPSGGATLNVYGDLNVYGAGILAASNGSPGVASPVDNSTIILAGGNQAIRGVLNITDLKIAGTGIKYIINTVNSDNTLVFAPGVGAIMQTAFESTDANGQSTFLLNTTQTSSLQLNGAIVSESGPTSSETNTAYVQGITIAQRSQPTAGQQETYGNIGLDITSNNPISSLMTITRTVGQPLNSPTFPGRTPNPIKRQYGVSGDVNNSPNVSTIVFHYLNSTDELNGNLDETDLAIFKATNNGPPYTFIGGTPNPGLHTITKSGVGAINTITLGSKSNPLPVRLTAFDAKRIGNDALVTWQTATEENSKGYEVQVSTNGTEYRTLASVPSASPNTMQVTNYSYVDKAANKTGKRYYRLHQLDLDGKDAFFAPTVVSFDGKAPASNFVAYPNPINNGNEFHVALQSAATGTAKLLVTDMTGRTLQQQNVVLTGGLTDASVAGMGDLKAGMYLVKITLPSGEVKNLKVVKQ
ncbi:T9SS type A sorting domain-containing protein [Hymenobacter siberiensis]|uniref:T9SS type A sorting domain-containing protein n=1 Tax=Hymenobacter siberiensis TaxID=2848396 RepID=UPI001C1DF833|nr:T9SS type A sorting domain-containing protein [Hymenobacter siberiensis]